MIKDDFRAFNDALGDIIFDHLMYGTDCLVDFVLSVFIFVVTSSMTYGLRPDCDAFRTRVSMRIMG